MSHIIRYKCSKCGGPVAMETLTSYPSKDRYRCIDCGATKYKHYKIIEKIIDMDSDEDD